MKVYTEILKQFVPDLPDTKTLQSVLTNHAFEVEEIVPQEIGDIIDLKVLPDRAHDALSHRGIAREIATHTEKSFFAPFAPMLVKPLFINFDPAISALHLNHFLPIFQQTPLVLVQPFPYLLLE